MDPSDDLTALLQRAGAGDRDALDAALPRLYAELRRLAERELRREADGHTLSPTALVHEAYLRLAAADRGAWRDRAHFLGAAAVAMRRILVDHARRHRAGKRGAGARPVSLDAIASLPADARSDVLVALDEALDRLARLDARQARVVECRFFGGLTEDETAEALGIGVRTVKRDWARARAWLLVAIEAGDA